jgi:ribonuclease HII
LCFNPDNKPKKELLDKINDSKKLSEKKREELYKELIILANTNNPQVFFGV